MTNRSNSFWRRRQTVNGLKRKETEIALKRYVAACEKDIQAFIDSPTMESLESAKEALNTFQALHTHWVAPYIALDEGATTADQVEDYALQGEESWKSLNDSLRVFLANPTEATKSQVVHIIETRCS